MSKIYISYLEFFPSVFFVFSFQNTFFLTLELSILYLSIGSCFCEKNCLWSFKITKRDCLWSLWSPSVFLSLLCARLVPSFLCRGDCVERGVAYSWCWVIIPQWKFLCGRSCVDIEKIFLCESGNVEQWLESWNISLYLWLIYSLSYFLRCFTLFIFIYMLDIVCVPTFVFNQESF